MLDGANGVEVFSDTFTHIQRLASITASASCVCRPEQSGFRTRTDPYAARSTERGNLCCSQLSAVGQRTPRENSRRRRPISQRSGHWRHTGGVQAVKQDLSAVPVLNISWGKKENTLKNSGHSEAEQKSAFLLITAKSHFGVTHAATRGWRVYYLWTEA